MLILVRHGRTASNAAGLLLGRANPSLDETGKTQARDLGRVITEVSPARVISSPLVRARETAEAFGVPITVDERWIELDYGEFDQLPMQDVPIETWTRWRNDPSFEPPGGESLATLGRRVSEACSELAEDAGSTDIVVVTHVSPIKAAVAWALQVGDEIAWKMHVSPASITRIAMAASGPSLVSFSEVHHLTSTS